MGRKNALLDVIETGLDLRPRTRELYLYCAQDFVASGEAHSVRGVENWLRKLLETHQPQTVRVYRKAVRYASRRIHELSDGATKDFARNVPKIKARRPPPRQIVAAEDIAKLLETCAGRAPKDVRDRALLLTAFRTGLRRGGLCALDIEGVRPPKLTTINKGGELLTFVADNETLAALADWLNYLHDAGMMQGAVFRYVAHNRIDDCRLTPFQIWYIFCRRAQIAGISHVFPHLARHTVVTMLREAGVSAAEISKLTGQTERTIENIYTHVRTQEAVANRLPSFLRGH
jgi:integrase